jgi:hypothetical protein
MKISPLPLMRSDVPIQPVLRHTVEVSDNSNSKLEILDWVQNHVVGAYASTYVLNEITCVVRYAYRFELEDDAFRFKLWWG